MLSFLGSRSCFVGSRFYPHCPSPSATSVQIPAVHVYMFQGGTRWGQNGPTLTDVWVSLHINCSGSNTVSHIVSSHDPGSAQIATSENWERIVHIGRSYYLEDRIFWPCFATTRPTKQYRTNLDLLKIMTFIALWFCSYRSFRECFIQEACWIFKTGFYTHVQHLGLSTIKNLPGQSPEPTG